MNRISVDALVKTYGDTTAVNGISFDVSRGEILGILGPNGSGKTTTIKSILGLVRFDSGSITVDGLDSVRRRNRILERTGAVLEGARNTYWFLSPRENLVYFAGLRGLSKKEAGKRTDFLLERLELADVADRELRGFSAGMKQKTALACAFIHDPDILLLDEPALGLDVEITRHIRDWLMEIVEEEGKTILITSHNMDFIESVCHRILIMRKGEIVSHETVSSLKKKFSGRHFRFELESPPADGLMTYLTSLGNALLKGNSLQVELDSMESLLPMIKGISESGCGIRDFRTVENDLEDIFLEMVKEKGDEEDS